MHTVRWTNLQLMTAHRELQHFLSDNEKGAGATAYKATRLFREIDPAARAISEAATQLVAEFARDVDDGKGGTKKMQASVDGYALPLDAWCTNPAEYGRRDRELLDVEQEVRLPVRLTYEELVGLPIRKSFWNALYDVIDPPRDDAPAPTPAPPPA